MLMVFSVDGVAPGLSLLGVGAAPRLNTWRQDSPCRLQSFSFHPVAGGEIAQAPPAALVLPIGMVNGLAFDAAQWMGQGRIISLVMDDAFQGSAVWKPRVRPP